MHLYGLYVTPYVCRCLYVCISVYAYMYIYMYVCVYVCMINSEILTTYIYTLLRYIYILTVGLKKTKQKKLSCLKEILTCI